MNQTQTQILDAIYENGILRPLQKVVNIPEHCQVKITIEVEDNSSHPLLQFAGILSHDEAEELEQIITKEFEVIDPHGW